MQGGETVSDPFPSTSMKHVNCGIESNGHVGESVSPKTTNAKTLV